MTLERAVVVTYLFTSPLQLVPVCDWYAIAQLSLLLAMIPLFTVSDFCGFEPPRNESPGSWLARGKAEEHWKY